MNNDEIKDIVPAIFEKIEKTFKLKTKESKIIKKKLKALKDKRATYQDANDFAIELGDILASAFSSNISTEDLPDGKMYYNIAKRLIEPNMIKNYELVGDYARIVQESLNKQAQISIEAQKADLNQDRIDKLVNKISEYDSFEQGNWLLNEPIKNFTQAIVDDTIKKNADLHYKAGLRPKIIRREKGNCCDWCKSIAGVYDYQEVKNTGNDVFSRHRYCRCTVDYVPGDGRKQDVWSKQWKIVNLDDKNKRIALSEKQVNNKLRNIARSKAMELGYNPLPDNKVVNVLRKDAKKWIQILSEDEIKAIRKYTYNGKDSDGLRLFEKINGYLENRYDPANEKEEEIILRNAYNIEQGLLKNRLEHDIIVYRNDLYPQFLPGSVKKFLSSSITRKGTLGKNPNISIIVPKETCGSYIENLSKYNNQREFLLNRNTFLEELFHENGYYVYIAKRFEDGEI